MSKRGEKEQNVMDFEIEYMCEKQGIPLELTESQQFMYGYNNGVTRKYMEDLQFGDKMIIDNNEANSILLIKL